MADPVVYATLSAVGLATQLYGQWKSSKAQSELLERQAEPERERAAEIIERAKLNNRALAAQATEFSGRQIASFAGSGRAQSATTLELLKDTLNRASKQMEWNMKAARWEARMVEIGAASKDVSAKEITTASIFQGIGTALSGSANIYESFAFVEKQKKPGAPEEAPKKR